MADPIDPRLQYASGLPPRSLSQPYPSGPTLQNGAAGHQPYYLPASAHPPPPLAPAAPPSNLDPALEDASPAGREGSADDHDDEVHDDHDGYVPAAPAGMPSRRLGRDH